MKPHIPEDLPSLVKELSVLLTRLSIVDNFGGFLWEGSIPQGDEVRIRNQLANRVPRYFLLIDARGTNLIVRGDEAWSLNYVTLQNIDAALDAEVSVFFMP